MVDLLKHPKKIPGGLPLESSKALSLSEPLRASTLPERFIVPLSQHIGDSAEAVVKTGNRVLRNQLIARSYSYISAPVHAPTSGKIIDIGNYPTPHPSGLNAPCIVIESDGDDQTAETDFSINNPYSVDPNLIRQQVRNAGIVGLGGAGFPTSVKMNPGPERNVELLIINAAECEPYISCDEALIRARPYDIIDGIRIMRYALNAQQVVIGIEDNMPEAAKVLQDELNQVGESDIRIIMVPSLYPAGGEKQLIYTLTGEEVPSQGIPIDLGIICHNVGTVAAVARCINHGEPLLSRIVSVTGKGIQKPANLDVRIGTPVAHLVEQCGGYTDAVSRLLMGGPMMGFALPSDTLPVIKTTNCILATTAAEAPAPDAALPCIRCGACSEVCPAELLPQQLFWYAYARDFDKIQDYNLFDCIECGCCAYVCPSHIPLVQYYRFAKTEIWNNEHERSKSNLARERHEFRAERLKRDKKELEARRAKAKKALNRSKTDTNDSRKSEIEAALARVRARKEHQPATTRNTNNLTPEQQARIAEIDARRAEKPRSTQQDR